MRAKPYLFEPYAGSAAVSMRLLGVHNLCPYMGGKRFSADKILDLLDLRSAEDCRGVYLSDTGLFGEFWRHCSVENLLRAAEVLLEWERELPAPGGDRALFERLTAGTTAEMPVDSWFWLAAFLFLQTRSYRGKPVWRDSHGWKTHGFDPEYRDTKVRTSPKTHNRGWASPRKALAERLQALAAKIQAGVRLEGRQQCAGGLVDQVRRGDRVFLDPPYGDYLQYGPLSVYNPNLVKKIAAEYALRGALVVLAWDKPDFLPGAIAHQAPTKKSGRLKEGAAPLADWLLVLDGR
jgi:hypothetical protein